MVCHAIRRARTPIKGGRRAAQEDRRRTPPLVGDTVNRVVEYSPSLDATFAAVSDPTRRRILSALTEGEASVTQLAEPFDVSLQAVSKHIGVLATAGLVAREKKGRVHWCSLAAAPMKAADEWLGGYREFWEEQLDSLDAYLATGGKGGDRR
jgi:DNA-binding transcriptional ArsR family regulator